MKFRDVNRAVIVIEKTHPLLGNLYPMLRYYNDIDLVTDHWAVESYQLDSENNEHRFYPAQDTDMEPAVFLERNWDRVCYAKYKTRIDTIRAAKEEFAKAEILAEESCALKIVGPRPKDLPNGGTDYEASGIYADKRVAMIDELIACEKATLETFSPSTATIQQTHPR